MFWSEFEQAGSTLNLFADRDTDELDLRLEFPSCCYQSLNALFIILLAPVFAWFWLRLGRAHREPSSPAKFALGLIARGRRVRWSWSAAPIFAERGVKVSPMWLGHGTISAHRAASWR